MDALPSASLSREESWPTNASDEPRGLSYEPASRTLPAMGEVRLEHWHQADGPPSEKRMMSILEQEGYEVAVYTYREGTVFPEHEHAQAKCDGVVEGVLRISVGGEVYDLKPGDRLYLPAGTRHSAEVVGKKTVVSLDGTKW